MYLYLARWTRETLPPEQLNANQETMRRVAAAVRRALGEELIRSRFAERIYRWNLTLEESNKVAQALGDPPITPEEWAQINDTRICE